MTYKRRGGQWRCHWGADQQQTRSQQLKEEDIISIWWELLAIFHSQNDDQDITILSENHIKTLPSSTTRCCLCPSPILYLSICKPFNAEQNFNSFGLAVLLNLCSRAVRSTLIAAALVEWRGIVLWIVDEELLELTTGNRLNSECTRKECKFKFRAPKL